MCFCKFKCGGGHCRYPHLVIFVLQSSLRVRFMPKLSKRMRTVRDKITVEIYSAQQALELLQSLPAPKFIESIDVAVNLGIDPRKSDQIVRGAVTLPHGSGKTLCVAVIADGEEVEQAKQAGADLVGKDLLIEDIRNNKIDFDVLLATPASMPTVGKLGTILGPKGLMPNPKLGTVTNDLPGAVRAIKKGRITFRTDKNGIIHGAVGKRDFPSQTLLDNLIAFINELKRLKPASSKGTYFRKITLSTTMGPGLTIDHNALIA